MIVPEYVWPALFWLGISGLIHTLVAERRRGLPDFRFWSRMTACSAAFFAPLLHDTDFSSPGAWPGLGLVAACVGFAARRAWLTRPLPAWHEGAHERIENP